MGNYNMKKTRKIVKLALPGWFMHWWLPKRYGIAVKVPASSMFAKVLILLSPYAVSAILQQRVDTDRRVLKYFLPYGKMCARMMLVYGRNVGNAQRDKGFWGRVRSALPYGLILWWDREDKRIEGEIVKRQAEIAAKKRRQTAPASTPDRTMVAEIKQFVAQQIDVARDRMEVLSMRSLVGSATPSVSVVVTGSATQEEVSALVDALGKSTMGEIEIIAVASMVGDSDAFELKTRRGVRAVVMPTSGSSLCEARNLAIGKAKGDYIVFLDASTRYASDDMLEWMVLAAKVEHADVCACRVRRDGQVVADDISGMVFDLAWLRSSGIEFVSDVDFNDCLFRRVATDAAKRVLAYPKVAAVRSSSDFLTAREKGMDVLRSIAVAARSKMSGTEMLQKIAVDAIRLNQAALRALVWDDGSMQQSECNARELLRSAWTNLGLPAEECELLSPLVSVIVPAYNVEKYLPRCLDSLAAQTFAFVEIIVVDDGSTDSTLEIAKSYAEGNARFKVVHRDNGGLSAARNSGLAVATGKYVGFVDGDDYVDRAMFETMSNLLEKDTAAEIAVCGAKVEFSYPVDAKTEAYAQKYFELPREGGADLDAKLVHDITSSVCTKLYRRSFLRDNGIRFPEGMENEDEVFFFFTMGKAHRVEMVKRPFYHYIRNESGIMARQASAFDSEGVLPDSLCKAFPLVFEYLKCDDRRDLLGVFYRHVCGAASRYQSSTARSCISYLLHSSGFFYNREFLDTRDLGWVDNQLKMCNNYDFSSVPPPVVNRELLPKLRARVEAAEKPALTFIVPVFNQERYLSYCLESIRRQTERNIEIICVNDGSTDHSDMILKTYSEIDGRIVVLQQTNKGVSAARNLALESARGRYVAFVDGDDHVSASMAADLIRKMDRDRLDVCLIDFDCFDYNTRKPMPHYWQLRNHRSKLPARRVFSFGDIQEDVFFFGGAAGSVWSMEYLNRIGLRFPNLVNNEDLMFSMNGWVRAGRMGIALAPYYHYRRGNPSSAVSNRASGAGDLTVIDSFHEMLKLWRTVSKSSDSHVIDLVARRLLVEFVYHGARPKVLAFLQEKGFDMFGFDRYRPVGLQPEIWKRYGQLRDQAPVSGKIETGYDVALRNMPASARQIVERIESRRQSSVKDLYIITGQLNSSENAPIDSWTFFKWLQSRGVPSRYVMWKKHKMYEKLKAENDLKDVILLDGDGCQDYEFVEKCEDELVRCKMVAQENGALNRWLRVWLYYLPDCQYTYLEHGIKFLKHSAEIGRYLATYNVINNTSVLEKEILESNLPGHYDTGVRPTCIVGGLPRLDLLHDERSHNGKDYTVFIMLTWRSTFNDGQDVLEKSAYGRGIRALLCEENIKRLEKAGVKIVLTAHHHLVNHIKNLDFGTSIKIVPQEDVAYWKSHADCCVTDYSSISFDFLFLGRPVVYWTPDREDLLLNSNDYAEIVEAESRKKHIFNVVYSPADVINMIENYAKNGFVLEPEKAKIVEKFFAYRTDFCQHLYDALEAVINQEKAPTEISE